jgi:hypothetical protein
VFCSILAWSLVFAEFEENLWGACAG